MTDVTRAGMKTNPGYRPADFDRVRGVMTASGHTHLGPRFDWRLLGIGSDIALYWPKAKTFAIEMTAEEITALVCVLGYVGGDPKGPRQFADTFRKKLPGLRPWKADWINPRGNGLYFNDEMPDDFMETAHAL